MATRPNQEAIETFMSITGVDEPVAAQKLEEHGGDLNEAVNAHFSEGDRNIIHETTAAAPQSDFMDIDNPIPVEPLGPRLFIDAATNLNTISPLDPSFRSSFDSSSSFMNPGPSITHPREVREIPIEVKDGSEPSGHSPTIEDVTGTAHAHGLDNHGTVIIDDEEDEGMLAAPATQAIQQTERDNSISASADSTPDRHLGPSAPEYNLPYNGNDIEEEMIRAAIEASKRDVEESYPNQHSEQNDFRGLQPQQRQSHLEDPELAHAVSLSLKTAEKEKALREKEGEFRESKVGNFEPALVDLEKIEAANGRLEPGSSSIKDEAKDVEEQPLVGHRSRHMSSGSVESGKAIEEVLVSPPSSPGRSDARNHLEHNGSAFPSEEWGGISSEEHDEAVMLEAAMFGGIPEGRAFNFPYAPHGPHQYMGTSADPLRIPRPPSPSLEAQRLIREQQDDEYLASLQADREKELKAMEEAEARRLEEEAAREAALEEKRKKEEESCRKLEEEQESERQLAAKEASLPQEPASDDESAVTLLVRMPDGSRRGRRFLKSDKLQSLFDFIDVGRGVKPGTYRLVRPYPRRAFSDGESTLTLNELGLTSKQEALFLELI